MCQRETLVLNPVSQITKSLSRLCPDGLEDLLRAKKGGTQKGQYVVIRKH